MHILDLLLLQDSTGCFSRLRKRNSSSTSSFDDISKTESGESIKTATNGGSSLKKGLGIGSASKKPLDAKSRWNIVRTNVQKRSSIFSIDHEARDMGHVVDKWSRVMFPMAFLAFNLCYWLYYAKFAESEVPDPT